MSSYSVAIKRSATKGLKALPTGARQRIRAAIFGLAEEPRPHGHKTLDAKKKVYRIRVGDYRVIYQVRDAHLVVLVVRIANRRDVYDRLQTLLKLLDPPEG